MSRSRARRNDGIKIHRNRRKNDFVLEFATLSLEKSLKEIATEKKLSFRSSERKPKQKKILAIKTKR